MAACSSSYSSLWASLGRTASGSPAQGLSQLISDIRRLPAPEAEQLVRDFFSAMKGLNSVEMIYAASFIASGSSSEGNFQNFRAWVVLSGESAYCNALSDPDTVARSLPTPVGDQFNPIELREPAGQIVLSAQTRNLRPESYASTEDFDEVDELYLTVFRPNNKEQLRHMVSRMPKLWSFYQSRRKVVVFELD